VVVIWFTLVFFYDLALLGVLVVSDGAVSQEMIASLVFGNPAGLYRVQMMSYLAGPEVLQNLGMAVSLPQPLSAALIWIAWIFGPVLVSGVLLSRRKVV
jgi:Cu-processing system permease protein